MHWPGGTLGFRCWCVCRSVCEGLFVYCVRNKTCLRLLSDFSQRCWSSLDGGEKQSFRGGQETWIRFKETFSHFTYLCSHVSRVNCLNDLMFRSTGLCVTNSRVGSVSLFYLLIYFISMHHVVHTDYIILQNGITRHHTAKIKIYILSSLLLSQRLTSLSNKNGESGNSATILPTDTFCSKKWIVLTLKQ